ncbi:RNA polymerase sigma factor [Bacillus sp. FJAT-22090]|uniref:RNA polymerase sigma factor n=1 Tax=Bacillus sp. FJAT-22090 TaxID=1581038 RepID=UPI0011A24441|nr:RNA polymerase sigma factor [Bacillus sp. FJAT-22090]
MRPLVENTPIDMNEEFEMAIQPYTHDLRKYCLSLANTKWDGEDLLQETLLKAYESWMKKPKQMAKAYLYRIASNTWIDKHRKRKVAEDMKYDLSSIKSEDKSATESLSLAINVLLNQLTAKQRAIVLFIFGFGYTAKQTADLLSVTEGSIKAALHRARKALTKLDFPGSYYELDDDRSFPYINALNNGNPEEVVRLYQKEIHASFMRIGKNESLPSSTSRLQTFVGGSTPYVLISIPKKNGELLFVPFYQLELSALLSQIAWLKQEFSAIA